MFQRKNIFNTPMYISEIKAKDDYRILLDRLDYEKPYQLKESSFKKILYKLDSLYTVSNDVKLELVDLEVNKFISYIRYRYQYSELKFLFCEDWYV
jgi:hypothetical protein